MSSDQAAGAAARPEGVIRVDVAALRERLDAPYGAVRARMRATLAEPGFRHVDEGVLADRERYREQVLAWCRELARRGFGALSLPRQAGGEDDLGSFIAAFETLALHDGSLLVKFGVQFGLFAGSILQLGTERHHRAYLPAAGTLELPGCFAMSETLHGSNVADIGTVARYDAAAGEFEIDTPRPLDRKDWIGNAARHGRLATVFAQLETGGASHGVHAFVVPIRDDAGTPAPGVTLADCGDKGGLNGVDNGRISFARVRVPRDNLLDRFAAVAPDGTYTSPIASPARRFFTMLGTLIGGRISVAAAAVSAAKSGLAIALRYGSSRHQFGPPGEAELALLDYPSHQRRLLPPLAVTYALDFAHKRLVARFLARSEAGETETREVEGLAAALKAYASWHAVATLQTCRECCGGQGYLTANRLPLLRGDADIYTTFEGDNTVLLQQVAKGLLSSHREHLGHMNFISLGLYAAERAAAALAERNPIANRRTDPEHLCDPQFQAGLLRLREEHLLASVARRLQHAIAQGATPLAAFNQCQTHLLALGHAYAERIVAEGIADAADATAADAANGAPADGGQPPAADGCGPALTALRDLFALSRIEADAAWFLESGHMEPVQAKAVRRQVDRLCGQLRTLALPLVDAWGIPEACLAAPIASGPAA